MIYLNTWLEEIIVAIKNLNGEGTLEEIYSEIKKSKSIDLSTYSDWKAQVRKNIYKHSSDCDIFKGIKGDDKDVFYSVDGKGKGRWGVRKLNVKSSIFPFSYNLEYKRSEIHDSLGGNRQRGISSSKENPMIFIFSGKEGNLYGYKDGWKDDFTFLYTGEGQVGDQEFKEGNKALRDHVDNGKDVFIFEKNQDNGLYKFGGQLTLIGYDYAVGPDKFGDDRRIIIFEFAQTEKIDVQNEDIENLIQTNSLVELRKLADSSATANSYTIKEKKQVIRKRSAAIKKYALVRSNGTCEACNLKAPFITIQGNPFLEVHHLYRLSDGGIDHPENVAALCPNCHRRVHFGNDKNEYNKKLIANVREKETKIINEMHITHTNFSNDF